MYLDVFFNVKVRPWIKTLFFWLY